MRGTLKESDSVRVPLTTWGKQALQFGFGLAASGVRKPLQFPQIAPRHRPAGQQASGVFAALVEQFGQLGQVAAAVGEIGEAIQCGFVPLVSEGAQGVVIVQGLMPERARCLRIPPLRRAGGHRPGPHRHARPDRRGVARSHPATRTTPRPVARPRSVRPPLLPSDAITFIDRLKRAGLSERHENAIRDGWILCLRARAGRRPRRSRHPQDNPEYVAVLRAYDEAIEWSPDDPLARNDRRRSRQARPADDVAV